MFYFTIKFEHDGKNYTFSVDRFDDKKEKIYLMRLTDASLISECQASMLTLCNSLVKKYAAEQSELASFMSAAWSAIKDKEAELNKNWLHWPAWLRRAKTPGVLHTFI